MSKPEVGAAIPDIAMTLPDGSAVKPSDYSGRKLVLFFYPKDDTPGCTTENLDFTALAGEFDKAGTALLGISKDSAERHRRHEIEKAQRALARGDDPHAVIEAMSHALANKLLHAPTHALNHASRDEREQCARLISQLYGLHHQ